MASFSHVWMNEARFRDRDVLERVEANADVPPVLRGDARRRRFAYMLSHDGESAGFADYP